MAAVMPQPLLSMPQLRRSSLPHATDRIPLGNTGLAVSPVCLGMTLSPDTVLEAYEAGVNFFFVTADLHWPFYDGIRKGLVKLLEGNPARRDEIVVGVVSYLDNPLFGALQFNEVIGEVPGLERVDVIIAGAVSSAESFNSRWQSMSQARASGMHGARAIGASFHQRTLAASAGLQQLLDVSFIRYNSAHPGARTDLFPYVPAEPRTPVFNFKSTMSRVTRETLDALSLPSGYWVPDATDHYRFVLTRPEIDGILCSPMEPNEMRQLAAALELGPLSREEEEYMIWLSTLVHAPLLT
jgi:hypothetical protein